MRPSPSRSSSAATAVFGHRIRLEEHTDVRTARSCGEERDDESPIAQTARRQCDLLARSGAGERVEHGSADRAFGEEARIDRPRVCGLRLRRLRQAVVAARPGGDLQLARRDVAREPPGNGDCEVPAASRGQKADPAACAVVGDKQVALIRFGVACTERRAQSRLAARFVERVAPPAQGETPERGVRRHAIAQPIEAHARHDHSGALERVQISTGVPPYASLRGSETKTILRFGRLSRCNSRR